MGREDCTREVSEQLPRTCIKHFELHVIELPKPPTAILQKEEPELLRWVDS
jgi:hypothetical protein